MLLKERPFGGTYLRDIYFGVNGKWYRNSWKEFRDLDGIDNLHYICNYDNVKINKYGVKYGTSVRFWKYKGWIIYIDHYGWLQWYFRYWLGRRSYEDEREIVRWKGIVSRVKVTLVKMIKDSDRRYDDYNILPMIWQVLLHWGFQFVRNDLKFICFDLFI